MRIITTPWKTIFLEQVAKARQSIKITSPFIKENICDDILREKKENVTKTYWS